MKLYQQESLASTNGAHREPRKRLITNHRI